MDVSSVPVDHPAAAKRRYAACDVRVDDAIRHGLRRRQHLARRELDDLRALSRRLRTLEASDVGRSPARKMLDRLVSGSEQDCVLLCELLAHVGPPRPGAGCGPGPPTGGPDDS